MRPRLLGLLLSRSLQPEFRSRKDAALDTGSPWWTSAPFEGGTESRPALRQRDKLYATPSLHRQLQEAQVGPGRVLTIPKVEGAGNRKEWVVQPEAEPEAGPEPEPEPEPEREAEAEWPPVAGKRHGNGPSAAAEGKPNGHPVERAPARPPATSASGNGNGQPVPEGLSFAHLEQLMNGSLQASWEAWCALEEGPAFSGEDVRAVAITLFLECARKGIVLQPEPERVEEELPF